MLKTFLWILMLFVSSVYGSEEKKNICLNMIVKDESAVIERCLESVLPLIDYWVIVDTGSTDGTQEIIQNFLKEVPGKLYERGWVNFEHNRNEALQLARGEADYLLIVDADDFLRYDEGFVLPPLDKQFYFLEIDLNGTTYQRPQLLKSGLPWKWVGVLHEYLEYGFAISYETLKGVTYVAQLEGNRSSDPEKYLKDAMILEEALETNPRNSRYVFYLAQSYRDAEMPEEALKWYQKRVEMGGWKEEVFFSLYMIGKLNEILQEPYEAIVESYYAAFQARPSRAEPLYRLARFFRDQNQYELGYLAANQGLEIPKPHDLLFVESWVYDWGLLMEKSVSAYWIGNFEESADLSKKILQLENIPDYVKECAERNLQFATDRL